MELLAIGSESNIYKIEDRVIKDRVRRFYIEEELDNYLRKVRTTTEYNILYKLQDYIKVPKVYKKEVFKFEMSFIDGENPSLDEDIAKLIGANLKKLHDIGIIHYDLSIYNILYTGEDYYLIDFGLSFYSNKIEDKATDILVAISQAIDYEYYIIEAYNPSKEIINKIKEIRSRARYVG